MSELKKWMAIIMTSVTIMGNMTGQGIPVMGAEKEVQEVIYQWKHLCNRNWRKGKSCQSK